MKTLFLALLLPLTAHANCADVHPELITPKLNAAVHQQISDLFRRKGIAIQSQNIVPDFASTGFSTNFCDPTGKYVVINPSADIASDSGTKFYLEERGPAWDGINPGFITVYLAVLTSKGFDKEGNPINPHCTLKLAEPDISDYATTYVIRNSGSGVTIGSLPLPASVSLY